ncbi:MAG: hypothetical protein BWY50_01870 [Spirochaetes bacterium ADurb.Bin315]|nr:MAG: hypothetical protein BWY50_01870 [Spirochaetes bacterium ADurb.Bin315]
MFGKYRAVVSLVKADAPAETTASEPKEPTDWIALATEAGKRLVVGIVITSAAIIGLKTMSHIVIDRLESEKYKN